MKIRLVPTHTRGRSSIIKNILLFLMSLLFFFFVFEIVLHAIDYYPEPVATRANISLYDPLLGWKLKPYYVGVEKNNEFEIEYKTNNFGFRDEDFLFDDKQKIFFLGDSFTFGEGVERQEILSALLEEKFSRFDVMNLGVPGYGTDQELLLLQQLGPEFKPKIIVINYLVENIKRNENQFRRLSNPSTGLDYEKPKFAVVEDTLVLLNSPTTRPEFLEELLKGNNTSSFTDTLKKCYSCVFFYQRTKNLFHWEQKIDIYSVDYEANSSSWLLTKKILEQMKTEADSLNAHFLIVVIPLQNDVVFYPDQKLSYQLRFEEMAREGYIIVDLTQVLVEQYRTTGVNPYYSIDSHWNSVGQKIASNVITSYISNATSL